jgi:hypothetical protein
MTYPSSTDYVSALQDLRALVDPDLRRARLSVDPVLQIPIPASGNSAVVFRAVIGNKSHALRFFIREDASTRERYRGLRAFVVQHGLTDCTAATEWVDDAIVIRQQRWPMVNMEWVEGRSLDAYVEHLVGSGRAEALGALASAWRELIRRMQTAGFAHGDLQHGNVLVDTRGTLQLVDFDGAWFVGVTGPVPTEHGHPNYQLRERPWGRWMDTFPGLLIYAALRSLAIRPSLWGEFSGRENILFAKDDFLRPFDTEIWPTLVALGDPEVTQCLSQLRAACAAARGLTIPLESMLKTEAPTRTAEPVAPSRTAQMIGLSPLRSDSPWWTQTGGAGPSVASAGVVGAAAGPATTTLPPPPPKSPFERPTGDGFSAGQTRPSWFVPPVGPPGAGLAGPGPVRGPSQPPPRRPAPPPPGGPSRPPSPPPGQGRRRRTGLWVFLVLLVVVGLVVIVVVASSGGSSYGGGGSASRGGATSSYATDPPSPSDPSTTELTDVELLLKHVPSAVSVSCTTFAPPTTVVAALQCKPDVPFALRYYQYATNADMDDAFDSTYRTYKSGSCLAGEEGTETYDDDTGTGRYSCYRSNDGYNVMSWTHDETGILTLEISSSATFPELLQWAPNAGPAA